MRGPGWDPSSRGRGRPRGPGSCGDRSSLTMLAGVARRGTRSTASGHLADGRGSGRMARVRAVAGLTVDPVDITQHLAVLGRWRKVILASLFLGVILAALFTIKVPPKDGKIDWRRPEKWQSTSRILVTQSGFPWGRTTLPGGGGGSDLTDPITGKKTQVDPDAPDYADPSR